MMMINKQYDITIIKEAFWKTFHQSGELWFEYSGSDERCEKNTGISMFLLIKSGRL